MNVNVCHRVEAEVLKIYPDSLIGLARFTRHASKTSRANTKDLHPGYDLLGFSSTL